MQQMCTSSVVPADITFPLLKQEVCDQPQHIAFPIIKAEELDYDDKQWWDVKPKKEELCDLDVKHEAVDYDYQAGVAPIVDQGLSANSIGSDDDNKDWADEELLEGRTRPTNKFIVDFEPEELDVSQYSDISFKPGKVEEEISIWDDYGFKFEVQTDDGIVDGDVMETQIDLQDSYKCDDEAASEIPKPIPKTADYTEEVIMIDDDDDTTVKDYAGQTDTKIKDYAGQTTVSDDYDTIVIDDSEDDEHQEKNKEVEANRNNESTVDVPKMRTKKKKRKREHVKSKIKSIIIFDGHEAKKISITSDSKSTDVGGKKAKNACNKYPDVGGNILESRLTIVDDVEYGNTVAQECTDMRQAVNNTMISSKGGEHAHQMEIDTGDCNEDPVDTRHESNGLTEGPFNSNILIKQFKLVKNVQQKTAMQNVQQYKSVQKREQYYTLQERQQYKPSQDTPQYKLTLERQQFKPTHDTQQNKSTQERQQNKPTQEREQNKPTQEIKQNKPSQERQQNKRTQERQQNKPTQEREQYKPTQEREQYKPTQEREQYKPTQERQQNKPTQERQQNKPTQEKQQNKPTQEKQQNKPTQERQLNKPTQEREQNKPTQERQQNKPLQEREQNKPTQERQQNKPLQERQQNKSLQEREQNKATQERQENNPTQERQQNKSTQERQQNKPTQERQQNKTARKIKKLKIAHKLKDRKSTEMKKECITPMMQKMQQSLKNTVGQCQKIKEILEGKPINEVDQCRLVPEIDISDQSLQQPSLLPQTSERLIKLMVSLQDFIRQLADSALYLKSKPSNTSRESTEGFFLCMRYIKELEKCIDSMQSIVQSTGSGPQSTVPINLFQHEALMKKFKCCMWLFNKLIKCYRYMQELDRRGKPLGEIEHAVSDSHDRSAGNSVECGNQRAVVSQQSSQLTDCSQNKTMNGYFQVTRAEKNSETKANSFQDLQQDKQFELKLTQMIRSAEDSGINKCEICLKILKTIRGLKIHIRKIHFLSFELRHLLSKRSSTKIKFRNSNNHSSLQKQQMHNKLVRFRQKEASSKPSQILQQVHNSSGHCEKNITPNKMQLNDCPQQRDGIAEKCYAKTSLSSLQAGPKILKSSSIQIQSSFTSSNSSPGPVQSSLTSSQLRSVPLQLRNSSSQSRCIPVHSSPTSSQLKSTILPSSPTSSQSSLLPVQSSPTFSKSEFVSSQSSSISSRSGPPPLESSNTASQSRPPLLESSHNSSQSNTTPVQSSRLSSQSRHAPVQSNHLSLQSRPAPVHSNHLSLQSRPAPVKSNNLSPQPMPVSVQTSHLPSQSRTTSEQSSHTSSQSMPVLVQTNHLPSQSRSASEQSSHTSSQSMPVLVQTSHLPSQSRSASEQSSHTSSQSSLTFSQSRYNSLQSSSTAPQSKPAPVQSSLTFSQLRVAAVQSSPISSQSRPGSLYVPQTALHLQSSSLHSSPAGTHVSTPAFHSGSSQLNQSANLHSKAMYTQNMDRTRAHNMQQAVKETYTKGEIMMSRGEYRSLKELLFKKADSQSQVYPNQKGYADQEKHQVQQLMDNSEVHQQLPAETVWQDESTFSQGRKFAGEFGPENPGTYANTGDIIPRNACSLQSDKKQSIFQQSVRDSAANIHQPFSFNASQSNPCVNHATNHNLGSNTLHAEMRGRGLPEGGYVNHHNSASGQCASFENSMGCLQPGCCNKRNFKPIASSIPSVQAPASNIHKAKLPTSASQRRHVVAGHNMFGNYQLNCMGNRTGWDPTSDVAHVQQPVIVANYNSITYIQNHIPCAM